MPRSRRCPWPSTPGSVSPRACTPPSGLDLRVRLVGGRQLAGRLARWAPTGCCWSTAPPSGWSRREGLAAVSGRLAHADREETWPVVDRLTVRALLRRLAGSSGACLVRFVDDQQGAGRGRQGRPRLLRAGRGRRGRTGAAQVGGRWPRWPLFQDQSTVRPPRGHPTCRGHSGAGDPSTNGWSPHELLGVGVGPLDVGLQLGGLDAPLDHARRS